MTRPIDNGLVRLGIAQSCTSRYWCDQLGLLNFGKWRGTVDANTWMVELGEADTVRLASPGKCLASIGRTALPETRVPGVVVRVRVDEAVKKEAVDVLCGGIADLDALLIVVGKLGRIVDTGIVVGCRRVDPGAGQIDRAGCKQLWFLASFADEHVTNGDYSSIPYEQNAAQVQNVSRAENG